MTTTFRARFDGKALVPQEAVELPVGAELQVSVTPASEGAPAVEADPEPPAAHDPDPSDRPLMKLLEIARKYPSPPDSTLSRLSTLSERAPLGEGVPTDMAAQIDHYLYGAPKRP